MTVCAEYKCFKDSSLMTCTVNLPKPIALLAVFVILATINLYKSYHESAYFCKQTPVGTLNHFTRSVNMKQFSSIEKIDTAILYSLELASSLSVLLLSFGLIVSMANVLMNGAILSDDSVMSRIWSVTQCVAIDASVAGAIIRTYNFFVKKSWLKFGCILYYLLSFSSQQQLSVI